jgi:hypothetical protein
MESSTAKRFTLEKPDTDSLLWQTVLPGPYLGVASSSGHDEAESDAVLGEAGAQHGVATAALDS